MIKVTKVYLICGKICSGKSHYADLLKDKYNAVILSTDEATYALINNEQGEFYNAFAEKVNSYLKKKAIEITEAGANVILDWGFWTKNSRTEISEYLEANSVAYEWHYIDIDDETWKRNIGERNSKVQNGIGGSDFLVDESLLNKCISLFEIPTQDEIDVWYKLER